MPVERDDILREILANAKTIAVVGASQKPWRDSNSIAQFLMNRGYAVFPVNPKYDEVLGVTCYASLRDVPEQIDIVDVFRQSDAVPALVDEAIAVGAKTLWLQLGVVHEEAAHRAEQAGLNMVMDHCIAVAYRRLMNRSQAVGKGT
jgi:predicted CoA-binding protein